MRLHCIGCGVRIGSALDEARFRIMLNLPPTGWEEIVCGPCRVKFSPDFSDDFREFTVRVKDRKQNCVHKVHEWALSQTQADTKALIELGALLGHDQLEIVWS